MSATIGWIQSGLLLLNAILVYMYLRATEKIASTNQKQLNVSQEQLEAQFKPTVVACVNGSLAVELRNIGSGPALHLDLSIVPRGSLDGSLKTGLGYDKIEFLEPKQQQVTRTRTVPTSGHSAETVNGRSLRCEYKSLSGRSYFTVFDFDFEGKIVIATYFGGLV